VSDANGEATLKAEVVFNPAGHGSAFLSDIGMAPLVVLGESRGLIGLEEIRLSDFNGGQREIHLRVGCKVHGEMTRLGKPLRAQAPGDFYLSADKAALRVLRAMTTGPTVPRFEMLLPA
jgi:hypothetical protein